MANDFKSNSKSNIAIDSGTYSTMYTALLNKETILLEVDVANTSASAVTALQAANTHTASVDIYQMPIGHVRNKSTCLV